MALEGECDGSYEAKFEASNMFILWRDRGAQYTFNYTMIHQVQGSGETFGFTRTALVNILICKDSVGVEPLVAKRFGATNVQL
jgi:hypothetical protein